MPLLSVTMSAYKGASYIAEAIESVLAQTFRDWELVIVDDGSPDHTSKVVESFGDSRIRLHRREKNLGISATRNECLSLAKGEFVAILDQDDRCRPDRFERQVALLREAPSVVAVGSRYRIINRRGAVLSQAEGALLSPGQPAEEGRARFLFQNFLCNPSVMFRREAAPVEGYDPALPPAEDYWFWFQMALKGRVAVLEETLTDYRIHNASASQVFRQDQIRNVDTVMKRVLGHFFSESELGSGWGELHLNLFSRPRGGWNPRDYKLALEWMGRLRAKLVGSGIPSRSVEELLRRQWAMLCLKQRDLGPLLSWPGPWVGAWGDGSRLIARKLGYHLKARLLERA